MNRHRKAFIDIKFEKKRQTQDKETDIYLPDFMLI